jgi:hypothetical protein
MAAPDLATVRASIAGTISAFSSVPAHHLTDDTDIGGDIGLDEDETDSLLDTIEGEHGIELTLTDRHQIITFKQLVECVTAKVRDAAPLVDAAWGGR